MKFVKRELEQLKINTNKAKSVEDIYKIAESMKGGKIINKKN